MARPSKYHFSKLLEIEQPAVGHFYGDVKTIRAAASQWAKNHKVKIKTNKFVDDNTGQEYLQVVVVELPPASTD